MRAERNRFAAEFSEDEDIDDNGANISHVFGRER